ncbi:unnamed protein product, partial [Prorocentrum cordatum]
MGMLSLRFPGSDGRRWEVLEDRQTSSIHPCVYIYIYMYMRGGPGICVDVLVCPWAPPGWTPLFVPAAAILLEVGGALQHGALVAREFGKPCVAGIDDVLEKFKDGQLVVGLAQIEEKRHRHKSG